MLGPGERYRMLPSYQVVFSLQEDGWSTDPFKLVEKDGKLFGRGATDDKGPVIAWLNAIEAFITTKTEIPVNIKVILHNLSIYYITNFLSTS